MTKNKNEKVEKEKNSLKMKKYELYGSPAPMYCESDKASLCEEREALAIEGWRRVKRDTNKESDEGLMT